MTISVVQAAVSGNLSGTAAFGSAVTPGNTVVILVSAYNSGGGGAGMSSSSPTLGGSTPAGSGILASAHSSGSNAIYSAGWLLPAIASPAGDQKTLSITLTGNSGAVALFGYEISGLGSTPTQDLSTTGSAAASTSVSIGPTSAAAQAPEIILGEAAYFGTSSSAGPSGWTSDSPPNQFAWSGYQIATSSGGTYSWAQTTGSAGDWAGLIVSLYAPGGAAASATPQPLIVPSLAAIQAAAW